MDSTKWKVTEAPTCPHCKSLMEQMDSRYLGLGFALSLGMFNNECRLFKKGWDHMMQTVGQLVSYRFMIHPQNGEQGVIPAFSEKYLQENGKPRNPNYKKNELQLMNEKAGPLKGPGFFICSFDVEYPDGHEAPTSWAFVMASTLTAHTLNSGILTTGSSASFVITFAAASR